MKPDMIIFTIDLQCKPTFDFTKDEGIWWKTYVLYLGIFVFEFFMSEDI